MSTFVVGGWTINKLKRIPKGQSRKDNPEKVAT